MTRIEAVITVKAYPTLTKYGETVCVAGVRTDTPTAEWVRLYPVQFRDMPFVNRFHKYQHVSVEAAKHGGDLRPETWRPNVDSLVLGERLDTKNAWSKRRPYVEPLLVDSMCEVQRRQRLDRTSLGAFRPGEVLDLLIDDDEDEWSPAKSGVAAQPSLLFPSKQGLEKIPHRFRYRYRCGPKCRGHEQTIIDWEIAQAYRSWRNEHSDATTCDLIRQKFVGEMCDERKDTIFFVGNHHRFPESFMVLGVYWPPKPS